MPTRRRHGYRLVRTGIQAPLHFRMAGKGPRTGTRNPTTSITWRGTQPVKTHAMTRIMLRPLNPARWNCNGMPRRASDLLRAVRNQSLYDL
ncbi:hypothetical protein DPMN_113159 [Dreissena polymorpha]|uniref:Uncharacterized protein n=1 Tax=Dreissena polymorpha TaxID=45954 RepID=A0A9D4KHP9_DREPO|nr:hypothetical protein DPMN_113159 [Dreissena polymorpha]